MKRAYVPPHMRGKESAPAPAEPQQQNSAPAYREERPQSSYDSRGPPQRDSRFERGDDRSYGRDDRQGGYGGRDERGNFGGRDERGSFGRDDRQGGGYNRGAPRSGGFGGSSGSSRFSRDDVRSGPSGRSGPSLEPRDAHLEAELFGGPRQNSGIEFKNYDDIPVETSGKDVPEPISTFLDMEIHEVLKSNIELSGYSSDTRSDTIRQSPNSTI